MCICGVVGDVPLPTYTILLTSSPSCKRSSLMRNLTYISGPTQGQKFKWKYPVDHLIYLDEGVWVTFTLIPLTQPFLSVWELQKQLPVTGNPVLCAQTLSHGHKTGKSAGWAVHEVSRYKVSLPFTGHLLNLRLLIHSLSDSFAKNGFFIFIERDNFILFNEKFSLSGSKVPLVLWGQKYLCPLPLYFLKWDFAPVQAVIYTTVDVFEPYGSRVFLIPFNGLDPFSRSKDHRTDKDP